MLVISFLYAQCLSYLDPILQAKFSQGFQVLHSKDSKVNISFISTAFPFVVYFDFPWLAGFHSTVDFQKCYFPELFHVEDVSPLPLHLEDNLAWYTAFSSYLFPLNFLDNIQLSYITYSCYGDNIRGWGTKNT